MGRRKIEIRSIKDARNMRTTFMKRKKGIFKKVYEISTI